MDGTELSKESQLLKDFEEGRIPMMGFMRQAAELRQHGGFPHDPRLGTVVVAAFARHTEGRDLMACILEIEGFDVNIVERFSSVEDVVKMCCEPEVKSLCFSVQTTYDCPELLKVDGLLRSAGIRDRIVFNAGGSPISENMAEKAGCDVYAPTAVASVRLIKEAILKRM